MILKHGRRAWALALLAATTAVMQGCGQEAAESSKAARPAATSPAAQGAYQPVSVQHKLGTTVIGKLPQRVVALDMNEVDFLDQLGVPVAGMPKDFVPHFLEKYKNAADVQDTGAIVQPNLERVHAAKPDLILITSLQANHYKELSEIAKDHLITLGRIFEKESLARDKAAALDVKVQEAKRLIQDRPERALIVLHNNGAFSSFGVQSRYGFIFRALGVKPASPDAEAGLHGQPISSEFIQQANPDIIYVVDRTAVMERRPTLNAESLSNPLLRQTAAWQNGRVVFADAQAWYVMAASAQSLALMIDDVLKAYQN
jgi:iron complex transport system substrate-binding protein